MFYLPLPYGCPTRWLLSLAKYLHVRYVIGQVRGSSPTTSLIALHAYPHHALSGPPEVYLRFTPRSTPRTVCRPISDGPDGQFGSPQVRRLLADRDLALGSPADALTTLVGKCQWYIRESNLGYFVHIWCLLYLGDVIIGSKLHNSSTWTNSD